MDGELWAFRDHRRASYLRGRATLGAQIVGGASLSTLGFAFAVPFAAALRALVLELYVDRMAPRFGRTFGSA
jgi:hypothetical protein